LKPFLCTLANCITMRELFAVASRMQSLMRTTDRDFYDVHLAFDTSNMLSTMLSTIQCEGCDRDIAVTDAARRPSLSLAVTSTTMDRPTKACCFLLVVSAMYRCNEHHLFFAHMHACAIAMHGVTERVGPIECPTRCDITQDRTRHPTCRCSKGGVHCSGCKGAQVLAPSLL
jgi:hypothetical protein